MEVRKTGNTHPFEQYAWSGRYVDAPVVRWQDADDDGNLTDTDETLYYLTDANMNVTCLADAAGSPRERYAYGPYGKVTCYDGTWGSRGTSSYANDILYAGYRHDTETGLYHVRNRYYHPTLGRWGQRDKQGYRDGMNLYAFVAARPTVAIDPHGLAGEYPAPLNRDPVDFDDAMRQMQEQMVYDKNNPQVNRIRAEPKIRNKSRIHQHVYCANLVGIWFGDCPYWCHELGIESWEECDGSGHWLPRAKPYLDPPAFLIIYFDGRCPVVFGVEGSLAEFIRKHSQDGPSGLPTI